MSQISFAQNAEDVVLHRAFGDHGGSYIDVGASDPVVDSVTKRFYDAGWSGINVEPAQEALQRLIAERPRDVNLGVALGAESGSGRFFELPTEMTGCSTFLPELAADYRREGWEVSERDIEVVTLQSVWEEHVGDSTVDFLKVDVEGDELSVLEGIDLSRFRARVVVVEATLPGVPTPAHEAWEPLLTGAGYELTLFDGLNRFYVREEDSALVPRLSVPANYFDDYISLRAERWRLGEAQARADQDEARRVLITEQVKAAELERAKRTTEVALDQTRRRLGRSQANLRDARRELEEARAALGAAIGLERA